MRLEDDLRERRGGVGVGIERDRGGEAQRDAGEQLDAQRMPITGDAGRGQNDQVGMRERVAMLGGNIHIASVPGGGTTVHVEIMKARKAA